MKKKKNQKKKKATQLLAFSEVQKIIGMHILEE